MSKNSTLTDEQITQILEDARGFGNDAAIALCETALRLGDHAGATDEDVQEARRALQAASENIVTIVEVGGTELYQKYQSQSSRQSVHVMLDCERRTLTAAVNGEIGNGIPIRQYHGHVQTWTIPALKAEPANALLASLLDDAQIVCDGYENVFNGNNHVAEFSSAANEARERIMLACEEASSDETDEIHVWDADDWFGGIGGRVAQCIQMSITPKTTDEEIATLASAEEINAVADGVDELNGCEEYLTELRDWAIENADEFED